MMRSENDEVTVKIVDNGVGIPDGIDLENTDSMGLHLIQVLTDQLKGELNFSSNGEGTTFFLGFTKSDVSGVGSSYVK